jgi:hypothetical protein
VDATATGVLAAILAPHFDSSLRREAESFPDLTDYADRMMRRYFAQDLSGAAVDGAPASNTKRFRIDLTRTVLA